MSSGLILLADSITQVTDSTSFRHVVICGSHGGLSAGIFALQRRVKGAVFNDAGVGKDKAGIAALDLLEDYGVMAAAVDTFSARIGVASETKLGIISHCNSLAYKAGVRIGTSGHEAAKIMVRGNLPEIKQRLFTPKLANVMEIIHVSPTGWRIVTLDSNSMVTPENARDIVMTGSHGGLVGDQPAINNKVAGAFYNDAGMGKRNAGRSRLAWLQQAGIMAATVSAASARIGEGMDTYQNGIISYANDHAGRAGIRRDMKASEAAMLIIRTLERKHKEDLSI